MTAEPSVPRGRWLVAWFVGCALLGGAVGAVTAYLGSGRPKWGSVDLALAVIVGGGLGLVIGLSVAFLTSLVLIAYRMFGPDGIDDDAR